MPKPEPMDTSSGNSRRTQQRPSQQPRFTSQELFHQVWNKNEDETNSETQTYNTFPNQSETSIPSTSQSNPNFPADTQFQFPT